MTRDPSPEIKQRKEREAKYLARGFWGVICLVIFDITVRNGIWQPFWGFQPSWGFYVTWEAASILFTGVITVIYWHKYFSRGDETAYSDVLLSEDNRKVHLAFMIFGSSVSLIAAGALAFYIADNQESATFPMDLMLVIEAGCLVLGVLLLVFSELMVFKAAPKARMKAEEELATQKDLLAEVHTVRNRTKVRKQIQDLEKRVADYKDITDDIGKVLAFSDAPIAIAFFVIFLLVCASAIGLMGDKSGLIPPFIAGAVAFQLLYSNFVFFVEANGAFPKWATWMIPMLESLTPMIEGYPTVVDSQVSLPNTNPEAEPVVDSDNQKHTTSVQVEKE